MATIYTLRTDLQDDVDDILAEHMNDAGTAINEISRRTDRYAQPWGPGTYCGPEQMMIGGQDNVGLAADTIMAWPILVPHDITFDRVAVDVGVADGTVLRLMLFDKLATGKPGDLLHDFGTVNPGTTGVKEISGSWTQAGGWYWWAAVGDGACSLRGLGAETAFGGRSGTNFADKRSGWSKDIGGTTAPDPYPSDAALDATGHKIAYIWFRIT